MSEKGPICRVCKRPLPPERLWDKGLRCQACQDVAVHARLFPPLGAADDLAGVTGIP